MEEERKEAVKEREIQLATELLEKGDLPEERIRIGKVLQRPFGTADLVEDEEVVGVDLGLVALLIDRGNLQPAYEAELVDGVPAILRVSGYGKLDGHSFPSRNLLVRR